MMSNNDGFRELPIIIISYGHQNGKLKDFDLNYNLSDFNPTEKIIKKKEKEKITYPEAQKKKSEMFDYTCDFLRTKIRKNKKQIIIGVNCKDGQKWSVVFAKLLSNCLNDELIEGVRLKTTIHNRDTTCSL